MQIVFGCLQEDLEKAQWELIQQLEQVLTQGADHREVRRELAARWSQVRPEASPEAWARACGDMLLAFLTQRLAALPPEVDRELSMLRNRCAVLERRCRAYQEDPLQERLAELRERRNHWQETAQQQAMHIERLEQQLSETRVHLQQETARLENEITHLNEIVVRQQEALGHERT